MEAENEIEVLIAEIDTDDFLREDLRESFKKILRSTENPESVLAQVVGSQYVATRSRFGIVEGKLQGLKEDVKDIKEMLKRKGF